MKLGKFIKKLEKIKENRNGQKKIMFYDKDEEIAFDITDLYFSKENGVILKGKLHYKKGWYVIDEISK